MLQRRPAIGKGSLQPGRSRDAQHLGPGAIDPAHLAAAIDKDQAIPGEKQKSRQPRRPGWGEGRGVCRFDRAVGISGPNLDRPGRIDQSSQNRVKSEGLRPGKGVSLFRADRFASLRNRLAGRGSLVFLTPACVHSGERLLFFFGRGWSLDCWDASPPQDGGTDRFCRVGRSRSHWSGLVRTWATDPPQRTTLRVFPLMSCRNPQEGSAC